jgi:hypothetical protein
LNVVRCNAESNDVFVDIFDPLQLIAAESPVAQHRPTTTSGDENDDAVKPDDKVGGIVDAKASNEEGGDTNKDNDDDADDKTKTESGSKDSVKCDSGHPLVKTTSAEGNYKFGWSCDV